jgi:hypothetical protein
VTFVFRSRPSRQAVSAPLLIGAAAPEWALLGGRGEPTFIAFLRHVGCPFAELTVRQLREAARAFPGLRFVVVHHGTDARAIDWFSKVGGLGRVQRIHDPQRRLYARWGLGRTSLMHFAGLSSVASLLRLLPRGIRNRAASGSRWQRAGHFLVSKEGTVLWTHLPSHAGDVPDFHRAIEAAAPLLSLK